MYELKNIGKVFTSKFVGTEPSSYKKEFTGPRSYKFEKHWYRGCGSTVQFILNFGTSHR